MRQTRRISKSYLLWAFSSFSILTSSQTDFRNGLCFFFAKEISSIRPICKCCKTLCRKNTGLRFGEFCDSCWEMVENRAKQGLQPDIPRNNTGFWFLKVAEQVYGSKYVFLLFRFDKIISMFFILLLWL